MHSSARSTRFVAFLAAVVSLIAGGPAGAAEPGTLNVLMVVFDDLRADFPRTPVQQPSFDRFAERAIEFTAAYAQETACNPSRTSMLTGLRPGTTGIVNNEVFYRTLFPGLVTLPQLFFNQGYFTGSLGKVFHKGTIWRETDTWVVESFPSGRRIGSKGRGRRVTGGLFPNDKWLAARGTDADQADGATAIRAVHLLRKVRDRPFFIAVGFRKPHPQFQAPRADFKKYKLSRFPTAWDGFPGPDDPPSALPNLETAEILATLSLRDRRELMRGYYACTTFVDRQFGLLLDALDELDLWSSTIVIVLSDHGYHLGEHGWWGKSTLYEESLKVPLLLHVPRSSSRGTTSSRPVQLLDVYPTLAALAGLEAPPILEGRSLRPLLRDPDRPWFPALSQEDRGSSRGRTVREDRWRYTEWDSGEVELYDLETDPGQKINLAGDPAHAETRAELARLLDNS